MLGNIETYFTGDSKIVAGAVSLGAKIAEVFGGIKGTITNSLSAMSTAYSATVNQIGASSSVFTTVKGLVAGLGAGFKSLWAVIAANPVTLVMGVIAALTGAFIYLWQTSEEFRNSMSALWNETLKPIFTEIGELFTSLWNEHLQPLIEKLKTLWDEVLSPLVGSLADSLIPVLETIVKIAAVILTTVIAGVASGIETIVGVIEGIVDALQGIIDFITGIFTGNWQQAWEGVKEILSGILDAMSSLFSGWVDGIVNMVSTAISAIKSLFSSAKETKNLDVKTKAQSLEAATIPVAYSLEPANIPKLANGGVLYKSTLVEAGEYANARNNPEIVSPQSLMKETMESANTAVVNAIYSIGNQISKTVEDKDSDVYMDGDKVTRKITKKQKELSKYSSASLVTV